VKRTRREFLKTYGSLVGMFAVGPLLIAASPTKVIRKNIANCDHLTIQNCTFNGPFDEPFLEIVQEEKP